MRKEILIVLALIGVLNGCTSPSTKLAIQNYRKAAMYNELAFNNSTRIANEQMLLSLCEYIRLNPANALDAVKVTWNARDELEISREQFLQSQSLSRLTVGQYLYDQQGVLNVWFGHTSDLAVDTSNAANAADQAAGISSVTDLIPKVDSTTQPSVAPSSFQNILKGILGK
jgi:hypothetical protein